MASQAANYHVSENNDAGSKWSLAEVGTTVNIILWLQIQNNLTVFRIPKSV